MREDCQPAAYHTPCRLSAGVLSTMSSSTSLRVATRMGPGGPAMASPRRTTTWGDRGGRAQDTGAVSAQMCPPSLADTLSSDVLDTLKGAAPPQDAATADSCECAPTHVSPRPHVSQGLAHSASTDDGHSLQTRCSKGLGSKGGDTPGVPKQSYLHGCSRGRARLPPGCPGCCAEGR